MTGSALHLASGLLAAAGDPPSKTPFYVAGSLFAVWAVVLSAIGLRRADFPPTRTIARVVMAISAVGILATTSLAVATSTKETKKEGEGKAEAGAKVGNATTTVALVANPTGQLQFDKKALAAKSGKVTIALTNASATAHNVAIEQDGKKLGTSETITKSKANLTVSLPPGQYTFFCAVDAHRQAGMQGKLTVQ